MSRLSIIGLLFCYLAPAHAALPPLDGPLLVCQYALTGSEAQQVRRRLQGFPGLASLVQEILTWEDLPPALRRHLRFALFDGNIEFRHMTPKVRRHLGLPNNYRAVHESSLVELMRRQGKARAYIHSGAVPRHTIYLTPEMAGEDITTDSPLFAQFIHEVAHARFEEFLARIRPRHFDMGLDLFHFLHEWYAHQTEIRLVQSVGGQPEYLDALMASSEDLSAEEMDNVVPYAVLNFIPFRNPKALMRYKDMKLHEALVASGLLLNY